VSAQATEIVACLAPADVPRFRHFAAVCAATRHRLAALVQRDFSRGDPLRTKSSLEKLARESEAVLTSTLTHVRASGGDAHEVQIMAAGRAGLVAFVREVHEKAGNRPPITDGWAQLFFERDRPCSALAAKA
jgi:hypothetical protein